MLVVTLLMFLCQPCTHKFTLEGHCYSEIQRVVGTCWICPLSVALIFVPVLLANLFNFGVLVFELSDVLTFGCFHFQLSLFDFRCLLVDIQFSILDFRFALCDSRCFILGFISSIIHARFLHEKYLNNECLLLLLLLRLLLLLLLFLFSSSSSSAPPCTPSPPCSSPVLLLLHLILIIINSTLEGNERLVTSPANNSNEICSHNIRS